MTEQRPERLVSLDAFRGLAILGMLLVNNISVGSATPAQLTHAPWNGGVYFADLVFPWFLFIVGVALPWSADAYAAKNERFGGFYLKAARRALLLLAIGMFLDSAIARTPTFGLGVLQLIGLAYLVGALLIRLPMLARLAIAGLLLIAHWALIRFVAAPGLAVGAFEEDANIVNYLNQTYLAPLGIKGLISVATTGAMVLIGTSIGNALQRQEWPKLRRAGILAAAGVLLALIGWLWSMDLSMNKPLWTSPYILFCAGLGSIILAVFYLLIDIVGWKWLAFPFIVAGANAIAAYVVPIIVKVMVLQVWVWPGTKDPMQQAILTAFRDEWGPTKGGSLYTITYMAVWWLMLLYLYRKKLFLRV